MSTRQRTDAVHPLAGDWRSCRVLGEVFRPNANTADSGLFVRVEFDDGGRFRVQFDAVRNYE
jgi:hypothetical protein